MDHLTTGYQEVFGRADVRRLVSSYLKYQGPTAIRQEVGAVPSPSYHRLSAARSSPPPSAAHLDTSPPNRGGVSPPGLFLSLPRPPRVQHERGLRVVKIRTHQEIQGQPIALGGGTPSV